ncbi:PhoD-like phosphatase N-terminal domain-containing protein [Corynebacterium sp. CNCTC7651]|uniref:PhoD-like phosphatase N-terminal domain-containing protein n=1 Tax=Corynebacterium sp. CNCTC7651 TaxID=2815361 RepID=UPI001F33D641|nr:PhoD-like phosphatase N-terminal domain-containing protein [Corynebacterium sp. CNCTC7651]
MTRSFTRRGFLRTTAVATGAVGTGVVTQAWAQSSLPAPSRAPLAEMELPPLPFVHGVASGDPLPDAVIIWTRITPDDTAWPGSTLGAPTPVRWEIAADPDFARIVQTGDTTSTPERDHTIHVDVRGLNPGTCISTVSSSRKGPTWVRCRRRGGRRRRRLGRTSRSKNGQWRAARTGSPASSPRTLTWRNAAGPGTWT